MKTTNLAIYNNSWFNPGRGAVVRTLWFFTNAIFFNSGLFPINFLKIMLLRMFGAKVGKGVFIKPEVNIKYPWNVQIGNHVWIGEKVWIDSLTQITIEDHCCISQGAMLLTGNHNFKKATFDLMVSPIKLEQGAWVGAQSTVCPGVTCGSHSILTVGSVATSNLDAYGIYQGNPAKKVKERKIQE